MFQKFIPYIRYAAFLPLLAIIGLFVDSHSYVLLGEIAWIYLMIIVFLRPVADIFPNFRFLSLLLPLRKELGITSAVLGLAHGAGYFLDTKTSIASLSEISYWTLQDGISWGVWACVISIPLLLTSNVYSMKFLKKNWKPLQRLTYLFFIATAVHIALLKPHEMVGMISIVAIWAILWIVAYLKIKYTTHKTLTLLILSSLLVAKAGLFGYEVLTRESYPRPTDESGNVIQKGEGRERRGGFNKARGGEGRQGNEQGQSEALKEVSTNTTISTESVSNSNKTSSSEIVSKGKAIGKLLSVNSRCIGCDKCVRIDSEHFSMQGRKAVAMSQDNLDSTQLSRAISHCPVGAIELGVVYLLSSSGVSSVKNRTITLSIRTPSMSTISYETFPIS